MTLVLLSRTRLHIKAYKDKSENLKIVKKKNVYLRKLCVSFPKRRHQKKNINFILQIILFYSFFSSKQEKMLSRLGHYHRVIKSWFKIRVCVGVCFGHGFILTTYVRTTTRLVNQIQRKLILQATTKRWN